VTCAEVLDRYYGGVTTSARRKLCRGIEQVHALCRDADAFQHSDPCAFRVERERTSPYEVVNRCYAALRQPLDPEWPLRAGEGIQNLRSALDHVVFASTRRPSNRTQFPIYTDPCEFKVFSKNQIPRIPAAMKAIIENAQPYNHSPERPTRDYLEVLRHLSNIDKHRTLAAVVASIHVEWVGVNTGADVRWTKYASSAVVGDDETHISTYVVTYAPEAEQVDVEPGFAYEVKVERMAIGILKGIAIRVFEVLIECETGAAPDAFAYPSLY
jgi:hypothetical protein